MLTAQRSPKLVAAEAGLELNPADEALFERGEETILATSASEVLVIKRSVDVKLNLYGVIKSTKTTAETVFELLNQEGIEPGYGETVQPATNTEITRGLLISINREGIKTEVITENIAFETEVKNDNNLRAGEFKVDRAGVVGQKAVIYELTEEDGKIVSRSKLQEVILSQPISEIRLRGTKIVSPSFSSSVTVAGDKAALMSAAGIAESDFGYVDFIISHESTWRPFVANSYSGAYGLCQALPASKMASAGADYLTNPITQLRWCSGYAAGRYGSWAGAYGAWLAQGWW